MNRRDFLSTSLAALGCSTLTFAASTRPLGAQLYTVRDLVAKDLPTVLQEIRRIGYEEVETYWDVYNRPAAELKRLINDHGLRVPSGHFNYEGIDSKLDYAAALGCTYMICPILPEELRGSLDSFKRVADQCNRWGEEAKKRGLRFGFHNHNYEFRRVGTATGFDVLVADTDPNLVCLEMDCYWVTQAGSNPVDLLHRLDRRIRMLHLKDRLPGFQPSQTLDKQAEHFTPPGTGTIDWKGVFAAAEKAGVEHMFVEQDSGAPGPLESLRVAFKNLRPLLGHA